MFNSTVVDVAIGLVFTFLAVSLAVSAIVEGLASARGWRANTLLQGVKNLLNDPNFTGLARQVYNHALVSPRDSGAAVRPADLKNAPSYIAPAQFAEALLDEITKTSAGAPKELTAAINEITDPQLRSLLQGIQNRAAGDVGRMRDALATWFDNGMDRVGGAYKRWTQAVSLAVAILIAIVCNVDSIAIGRALWQQPLLAHALAPTMKLDDALGAIQQAQMPVGWTCDRFARLETLAALEMIAGWVITAFATLFGAPFWFDALQQFVRLKGSGPSPQEKRDRTGAAA